MRIIILIGIVIRNRGYRLRHLSTLSIWSIVSVHASSFITLLRISRANLAVYEIHRTVFFLSFHAQRSRVKETRLRMRAMKLFGGRARVNFLPLALRQFFFVQD